MTITYWPYDAGAGSTVAEQQWSRMARYWLTDGVIRGDLNALEVFADSTGMQVKIKSGIGVVHGHWLRSDAQDTYAIAAADATNPRIDRVVLYADWVNNLTGIKVVTGTPAGAPSAPALVQTDLTEWQVPLATVAVAALASTIAAANVTDGRQWAIPEMRGWPAARAYRSTTQSIPNSTFTAVTLSAIRTGSDPYRMWSSGSPTRLTAPVAGLYRASATAGFAGAGSAYRAIFSLRVNGTTYIARDTRSAASGHEAQVSMAAPPYLLAAGDYLELVVHQNSGGALNIDAFDAYTAELGLELIAAA